MIPIIIISLIVWTLIIEKQFSLKTENIDSNKFTEDIIELLKEKKQGEVMNLCETDQRVVPKAIKMLLSIGMKKKESLTRTAQQIFHEEYPKLEKHLSTIAVLASVAPLLGLLGTVTGMVSTFTAITLYGTGDPQSLAKGISQSLLTTQSGLIVAIPALFFHNHLTKRVDNIMNNLEKSITMLINFLTREGLGE